jgi:hypothetical protein
LAQVLAADVTDTTADANLEKALVNLRLSTRDAVPWLWLDLRRWDRYWRHLTARRGAGECQLALGWNPPDETDGLCEAINAMWDPDALDDPDPDDPRRRAGRGGVNFAVGLL